MKINLSTFQVLFLICLFGLLIVGYFILYDIDKIQKEKKAELFYRMYNEFFIKNPTNKGLIRALGNNEPILQKNNGQFDEYDIDDYLGHFELLKNYLDEGLAPEKDIYDSYSYYIIQAYQNKEIWGYVKSLRKETNDSTYYRNVEFLAKQFLTDNKNQSFLSH